MKHETLKSKYARRRPLAVYAESAFSGFAVFDYETGFEVFVIVARVLNGEYIRFFRRKIETEFSEEETCGKDFFRMYGNKYYLSEFERI